MRKTIQVLSFILLMSLMMTMLTACKKKAAATDEAITPLVIGEMTSDAEARLNNILGSTVDLSDLSYNATSSQIPASVFQTFKDRINLRDDFISTCYTDYTSTLGYYIAKNSVTGQTALMKSQLEAIFKELMRTPEQDPATGYSGVFYWTNLTSTYAFYVNRTGTLVFNADNTLSYNGVSADAIFNTANVTSLPKQTAMTAQNAAGTYTLIENSILDGNTGTPTGEKEYMLDWVGNTSTDQALLPHLIFKVLIISDKNILMTYPFVRAGSTPYPTAITYPSLNYPADINASKTKLIAKWNYLNVGSIEFKADNTWIYSQMTGDTVHSGTWDVFEISGIRYLKLLYTQTRVTNEHFGNSELKSFTNPRWVIVEYYADDNYFGMNVYRSSGTTLTGSWVHNNYDYMDNYWAYSYYPVYPTQTELNNYKALIQAKNTEDIAFMETCYEPGDPRYKKIVRSSRKVQPAELKKPLQPLDFKH